VTEGALLAHYRLVSRLGAGGMGVVYRAHDERLGRDVAIKVLPAEAVGDETARARLVREARTASSLNHPNICHIYEVGEWEGSGYITMELVEGSTLRDAIAPGGLPIDTAIRYAAQIADALAHAHEKGVIHRDLKSTNVVITPEGRAKVLDFGLAKREEDGGQAAHADPTLTQSGVVVGTPHYIPPEVLGGAKADARSDLWALGIVLHEMLSGELPFAGRNIVELSAAILGSAPAALPARVPPGVRSIVQRCLAKEPAQRYRRASEVHAALSALQEESAPAMVCSPPRRAGAWRAWVGAGLAAVAVAALLRTLGHERPGGSPLPAPLASGVRGPGPPARAIRSLAVLPLTNLSGDPEQEFFADGMTEELITNLAPIGSLKVISRTSVMRYKGTTKSVPEIARELKVDGIVEGSVLRSGERVRITAQLIDASEDKHLWAKSYERELREVLSLQREVAMDIAQQIQIELSPKEHAMMDRPMPMVHREANDLYLRGRHLWARASEADVRRSLELFERAIALDPRDPRYHSGLADAYLLLGQLLEVVPFSEAGPKTIRSARRAIELDETSADAHVSMAAALFFGDWNWEEGKRHLERALELSPGHSNAHNVYSVYLGALGDLDRAVAEGERARDLDPQSLLVNWSLGNALIQAERYDDAFAQARRTFELDPTSVLPQSQMVFIHEASGNLAAAIDGYETFLPERDGGPAFARALRAAYESGGADAYWRKHLEFLRSSGRIDSIDPCRVACLHARLGDRDEAFAQLDRAVAQRRGDALFAKVLPGLESLRDDPRFREVLRRIGHPSAS
jgi:serine/threonine-protein kinase